MCADCWRNQGCGLVSLTSRVVSSIAFTPTLSLSASQSSFLGSQLLYSCAPDDAVELVRVVGAELGRDRPLPRVLEVLRGDRVAVRPLEPVAEVIRDGLAVVARLEALGGGADRVQVVVELDERIHDVEQDVGGGDVGRQAGVERRWLGAPVHRDHLLGGLGAARRRAGAGSLVVVAAAAGRDQGETRDEQRRATARGSSSSLGRSFLRLHECSGAGSTPSGSLPCIPFANL